MDLSTKKKIMEELERFVNRKELYKREGKAWKREYMLFGPSITGKSRLIQAMTNFLNYEIYELKLNGIRGNNELLNLLITTKNNSILVVKDCSTKFPARHEGVAEATETLENQVTLSRLLNLFVGLWSSGGDGRIIVFITNHKEKVDLALHCILVTWMCMSICPVTFTLYSKLCLSIFDTLAIDLSTKKKIIGDLERFLKRKVFYKRKGKTWRREYMLFDASVIRKSRLIQAMTNFLNFDIYCLTKFLARHEEGEAEATETLENQVAFSGLLNLPDGLWSSEGDGRIIVFMTNHKEKVDPLLLHPGRLDVMKKDEEVDNVLKSLFGFLKASEAKRVAIQQPEEKGTIIIL
ncbi:hypothetical protein Patl1_18980 [Pistacia atlantica]|uniref:Uncharacterized protein n=1 Tax=Pistacia atlantica TaxID=434234 RepID=A0ACC1C0B3_9ROSI|nr:hypothetical protein Patl1_18980 [Pistacia atlantica]